MFCILVKSYNDVDPCYNILSFLFRLKCGIHSLGYEKSKLMRKVSLDKEHFNMNVNVKCKCKNYFQIMMS